MLRLTESVLKSFQIKISTKKIAKWPDILKTAQHSTSVGTKLPAGTGTDTLIHRGKALFTLHTINNLLV